MSFNQISICGYLGRDPELKYTPQGMAITNFSIATTEKRKENGETQEHTTWYRVTFWGRQAEVAREYLRKGSLVFVTGSMRLSQYNSREGVPRVSLEVNGTSFRMLGSRGENPPLPGRATGRSAQMKLKPNARAELVGVIDEEVPF